MKIEPIVLTSRPKKFTRDLDKAATPEETVARLERLLAERDLDIVAETRRVDTGRLDIPVYLSVCGADARRVMPTRKQMGKGASPIQAKASALMELMERHAFFSFWANPDNFVSATWSEAEKLFGDELIPIEEILKSVGDSLAPEAAREILDLVPWLFRPATDLKTGQIVWLPLDWFRMLNEFNGSSAGNVAEESILQGFAELVERHVCGRIDRERPATPTISLDSISDPVLRELIEKFQRNGVNLILKDFSLDAPLPAVAALAWDPATFPESSEIVFTAGAASSPVKAAVRAITEVAQLGGDFHTNSRYEASGLPKFTSVEDCAWLLAGPERDLADLPSAENADIRAELATALERLPGYNVYAVETTNPRLGVPAHYCVVPGFAFRERDRNESLGLFAGRKLTESAEPERARAGLAVIARHYPNAHFLPFFEGLAALAAGEDAAPHFIRAYALQPDDDSRGLAAFYAGYSLGEDWSAALPWLEKAVAASPDMRDYHNLLGKCHYRLGVYEKAEASFNAALNIDKGSAIDLANRGACRVKLDRREEAVADLSAALSLDPSLAFARALLADLMADGD